MNSMVLAMMDLQPSLLSSINNSDKLIDSCEIALRAFGLLKLPVVLTEQVPHKLGRTHEKLRSLISPSDLVFEKDSFSAFGCEQFVCHLKSHDFNHLY